MPELWSKESIYITLVIAFIPLIIILYKFFNEKPIESQPTFRRFAVKTGFYKSWLVMTFLTGISLMLVFNFTILNLLFYILLTRELFLEYRLYKFEVGKVLVYDYDSGTYEYSDLKRTIFFNQNDIKAVVVHEYLFRLRTARIADVYLEHDLIRITSSLVDFNRIPILETKESTLFAHYLKWDLPAMPGL